MASGHRHDGLVKRKLSNQSLRSRLTRRKSNSTLSFAELTWDWLRLPHDELPPWAIDNSSTPATDLTMYQPTIELRATAHDDVRAFLLPAVAEPAGAEQPEAESVDVTEQTREQRSRRSMRS